MKRKSLIGLIWIVTLSACLSLNPSNPGVVSTSTVDVTQDLMEKTQDYSAIQTIMANEQSTDTPTATPRPKTPTPWVIVSTKVQPHFAFATALNPRTPVYQGPATKYRMSCYVDEGFQFIINGKNEDYTWLSVVFSQGQTCYTLNYNDVHNIIQPDPYAQYWIPYSSYGVLGDLSTLPIMTPTYLPPIDTPFKAAPTETPVKGQNPTPRS